MLYSGWIKNSKRPSQITSIPTKNRPVVIDHIKSVINDEAIWNEYGANVIDLIKNKCKTLEDFIDIVNANRRNKEIVLKNIGVTFQNGALFDSLTVWENITFKLTRFFRSKTLEDFIDIVTYIVKFIYHDEKLEHDGLRHEFEEKLYKKVVLKMG